MQNTRQPTLNQSCLRNIYVEMMIVTGISFSGSGSVSHSHSWVYKADIIFLDITEIYASIHGLDTSHLFHQQLKFSHFKIQFRNICASSLNNEHQSLLWHWIPSDLKSEPAYSSQICLMCDRWWRYRNMETRNFSVKNDRFRFVVLLAQWLWIQR